MKTQTQITVDLRSAAGLDDFSIRLKIDNSSEEPADPRELARALGRAIALLDRSNELRPGKLMEIARIEMESSFISNDYEINRRRRSKKRKTFISLFREALRK